MDHEVTLESLFLARVPLDIILARSILQYQSIDKNDMFDNKGSNVYSQWSIEGPCLGLDSMGASS